MDKKHPSFYGEEILRDREQALIQAVLHKYRKEKADASLQEKIFNELTEAKRAGIIKIPFKVILQSDPRGHVPPYVEVLLDTKV